MRNNVIMAAVTALLVGFVVGNVTSLGSDNDDAHEVSSEHMAGDSHSEDEEEFHMDGAMFIVGAAEAPEVSVSVTEDAKSGWNVHIETANFTFTPENVNGENIVGEGHAHLYVDGKKINRLYAPDFHYDESFDESATFRVTLNANDHSEYSIDGAVIEATSEVTHEPHGN